MDQSLEKKNPKNPMLISPVMRCILEFLNIEDIKNCRLVSREWGATGKLSLRSRAKIHINTNSPDRRPMDFQSCFLNSATLFSAFEICDNSSEEHQSDAKMIEELNMFFEDQQRSIKELTLKFNSSVSGEKVKNIDFRSWISKSPMVHRDANHMTKLVIEGDKKNSFIVSFRLIAEIKDLTLSMCRINLDAETKICPIKLKLENVTFDQGGNKLSRVQINDILDFCKAKEVSLHCEVLDDKEYIVDLRGNAILQKLILQDCKILNGEISQWVIQHLWMSGIPYSLNSEMKINQLYLSEWDTLDLSTLPNSIQKLALHIFGDGVATVSCSQPIVLQNLHYLHISFADYRTDLFPFMNCPRLTHMKFSRSIFREMKTNLMPKNLKTLTFEDSILHWVDDDDICLNLQKLIICRLRYPTLKAMEFFKNGIRVQDLVLYQLKMAVDKHLVGFLECRNRLHYAKRLYIGNLDWHEQQLEDSIMKEYVDVKSSFYVFEIGKKGIAIPEKEFYELLPEHMEINEIIEIND